jgi:hypothetical protein
MRLLSLMMVWACSEPPPQTSPPIVVAEVGGIDLAIDDSGVAWASWVADDVVYVARSDGGAFSAGFAVSDETLQPTVGTARRPHLAVDGSRIAVTVSDGVTPDAQVWLFIADRDSLQFSGTLLGETGITDSLDQPTVTFDNGEIWVAWKFGIDHEYGIAIGRESLDFAPVVVTGFPGQPCECCPHELTVTDRQPILVQRGNERDLREIYLGVVEPDGTADVHRVSQNDWIVSGCPFDGPVTARTDSGRLIASWVDGTRGDARAWVSRSDDGGVTWDDATVILPDSERAQAWPSVAAAGDEVWLTVEEIWQRTRLFHSADGGLTWEEEIVAMDLVDAVVASGGGLTGMIGLDSDSHLVWSPLGSH